MKYWNETEEEYLRRMTKQYARDISVAQKQMGIFKSNSEIWHLAEIEVLKRYKRGTLT